MLQMILYGVRKTLYHEVDRRGVLYSVDFHSINSIDDNWDNAFLLFTPNGLHHANNEWNRTYVIYVHFAAIQPELQITNIT